MLVTQLDTSLLLTGVLLAHWLALRDGSVVFVQQSLLILVAFHRLINAAKDEKRDRSASYPTMQSNMAQSC